MVRFSSLLIVLFNGFNGGRMKSHESLNLEFLKLIKEKEDCYELCSFTWNECNIGYRWLLNFDLVCYGVLIGYMIFMLDLCSG